MASHFLPNLQRPFLIGIILAIFFFSGLGVFSFLTISRHQDSAVWVEQSYEAIGALHKIPDDLRAMESGNRGFLLTHDHLYLSPYQKGHRSIQNDLLRARTLSHEIPDLGPLFNRLDPLVSNKLALIDRSVQLGRNYQYTDALEMLKTGPGKSLMDQVDATVEEIQSLELQFLQNRKTQEYENQEKELWTLFLSMVAVLALLLSVGGSYLRQARDIQTTALKLLSSEKRFRSLLDSTSDSFITADEKGMIVDANPATEILFGFAQDELKGQSLDLILAGPKEDKNPTKPFDRFLSAVEAARSSGTMEWTMWRKDKTEFPAEVSVALWKTAEGSYYTIISRDMTEKKFFTKMLMKNEHRLFQFLEAIPVGIFVLDRLGKPYYANQAAKSLFPKRVDAKVPPEQFAEAYSLFRMDQDEPYPSQQVPIVRALKGEKSTVEDLEIREDGRIVPLQAWGVPILDEAGKVKYCVGVFLDITERRQSMRALQEREEFFRTLFDDSPIGMTLAFPDSTLINVNRAFTRLTGYSSEELAGESYWTLSHAQDAVTETELDKKLVEKLIPQYSIEKRLQTKGGQMLWCKKSSSLILGVNEEPLFLLGIVENINDQKEAELALKKSEEQFRKVFEESPLGMVFADTRGNPLDANKSFCQMLGYTREELLKINLQDVTYPEDIEISRSIPVKPLTPQTRHLEFRSVTKDGRVVWVRVVPLVIDDNGKEKVLSIVEDISERKQVEDMKRDLLAVVSHQLKTPVAEINGYVENLLDGLAGDLTEKQRQYLGDMREIGVENYRLISDLLNMSKIERGVAAVNLQSASLWRILELSLRDYESTIQRKGLDLRIERGERDLELWADQDKTVEALRNIINNALKCTDRGNIALRVVEEGDLAVVEISDTGIGMKPEVLHRLFTKERIMGAEASRSGAGLGLFIAKSFLQLQGGDITVQSQFGQGSVFSLKLPKMKRSEYAEKINPHR